MRGKDIASTLGVTPAYVSQVLKKAKKSEASGKGYTAEALKTFKDLMESDEEFEPEEEDPIIIEDIPKDGEDKVN
jgi:predicted transcriptional regulator